MSTTFGHAAASRVWQQRVMTGGVLGLTRSFPRCQAPQTPTTSSLWSCISCGPKWFVVLLLVLPQVHSCHVAPDVQHKNALQLLPPPSRGTQAHPAHHALRSCTCAELVGGRRGGAGLRVQERRSRAQGSGEAEQGSGFRSGGAGLRVEERRSRAQGSGEAEQGSGFRSGEAGLRVQERRSRAQGSGAARQVAQVAEAAAPAALAPHLWDVHVVAIHLKAQVPREIGAGPVHEVPGPSLA